MRPYITVIIDSFREALASKILWILLLLSTLVLALLAPLTFGTAIDSVMRVGDVRDWNRWLNQLATEGDAEADSPGKYLWSRLSEKTRGQIREEIERQNSSRGDRYALYGVVLDDVNRLLQQRDFYDADVWSGLTLGNRTEALRTRGVDQLSSEELVLFNHLLLADAFRQSLAPVADEAILLSYAGIWKSDPLPANREIANSVVKLSLSVFMTYFVGVFGVFVAILVTSPMVPRTFEPGVIDLLLSKPISRSLLLLSKYLGGCAFILVNAGYFIVGLWLIVGLRFGIWNRQLLLCIPLFMFLFAIYYSVSTFAGMYWRNAIVSVVITILFWAMCFSVTNAKGVIESLWITPSRIVRLVPTDQGLVAVNYKSQFRQWDEAASNWRPLTSIRVPSGDGGEPGPVIVGPVYDPAARRLLFVQSPQSLGGFGPFGQRTRLTSVVWADDWHQETELTPPPGSSWLFRNHQDETLLVAATGIYRIEPERLAERREVNVGIVDLPVGGENPLVPTATTPPLNLMVPFAAAMCPGTSDVAIFSDGELTRFARGEEGSYSKAASRKMPEVKTPVLLGYTSRNIVLVSAEGEVHVLDQEDLDTQSVASPGGGAEPNSIAVDDQLCAVLYHDGELWIHRSDAAESDWRRISREASAVEIASDSLLYAEDNTRVVSLRLDDLSVLERRQPPSDWFLRTYYYGILPIYTIFPKPGELDSVVLYLLTDQETIAFPGPTEADPREARFKADITGPLLSNLAFVVVMLGISCLIVRRADL